MAIESGLLGNTIKQARILKKLSQEQLAELIGVSATHIKHIESEHRGASTEVLIDIVQELEISLDAIIFHQKNSAESIRKQIDLELYALSEVQLSFALKLLKMMKDYQF